MADNEFNHSIQVSKDQEITRESIANSFSDDFIRELNAAKQSGGRVAIVAKFNGGGHGPGTRP